MASPLPPVRMPPPLRLITRRRNFTPTAEELSRLSTLSDGELRLVVYRNRLNVLCRRWIIRFLRSHKPATEDLWRAVTNQRILPEVDLTSLDFDSMCCQLLREGDFRRLNRVLFELACLHVPEKAMHVRDPDVLRRHELMEVLYRHDIDVSNVQVESEGYRILAEEIRESVLGQCSWCRRFSMHILQQFNIVRRNVYTCLSCNNRTVACRAGALGNCKHMARGHATWDEESCIICSKEVADWAAEAKSARARCDWCDTSATHVLEKSGFDLMRVRDIYRCLNCNKRTLPCRKCDSFARGHGTFDDERCSRCVGVSEAEMCLAERRCSWCLEMGNHVLQQHNTLTRHVYKCDACQCQTIQCKSCVIGMARSSPGMAPADWRCVMCKEGIPWDTLHYFMLCRSRKEISTQATTDAASFARLESVLKRASNQKKLAFDAGMIRPFMVLVSMSAQERARVASLLDLNMFVYSFRLVGSPGLEDMSEVLSTDVIDDLAHKEAWHIIGADFSGIQARSNEFYQTFNANWDGTLYGVCKTVFNSACRKLELRHRESMRRCLNASDARLQELEAEIIERFGRMNKWVDVAKSMSGGGETGSTGSDSSSASLLSSEPSPRKSDTERCSDAFREAVWSALTWSSSRGDPAPMPRARRSSLAEDAVGISTGDISTTSEKLDGAGKFSADALFGQAATLGLQLAVMESAQITVSMGFALAGEILAATSVVLAVVAGVFLLWDVLHLLFGTSFSRLFPSVLIITAAARQLEERVATYGNGRTLAYFVYTGDTCDLPDDDSNSRRRSIVDVIGGIFTPSPASKLPRARTGSYASLGSEESVSGVSDSPGSMRAGANGAESASPPSAPSSAAGGDMASSTHSSIVGGGMASASVLLVRAHSIQDGAAAEIAVHTHDADTPATPSSSSPSASTIAGDTERTPRTRRDSAERSMKRRPSLLDSFLQLVNNEAASPPQSTREDGDVAALMRVAGSDELEAIEGVDEDQEDYFVCATNDRSALQFMH